MECIRTAGECYPGVCPETQLLVQCLSRAGFPKLNDFGNIFRDQGYQLGGDSDLPTHASITMGYWPVSIRTTVGYQAASVRTDGSGITSGGFGFTGLDILSFGTLHRNIAFGVVLTPGLGSAGFGTGASDSDLESAFARLLGLERFLGIKEAPGRYLVNLRVGKFELDVPFSENRSPTLNTPFVLYHYIPGTPYTASISGMSTSSYANPNSFMIGENQPGAELAEITKTDATDGYFRYSLAALATNTFSGPWEPVPRTSRVARNRSAGMASSPVNESDYLEPMGKRRRS